jgi:hypothetical protein
MTGPLEAIQRDIRARLAVRPFELGGVRGLGRQLTGSGVTRVVLQALAWAIDSAVRSAPHTVPRLPAKPTPPP